MNRGNGHRLISRLAKKRQIMLDRAIKMPRPIVANATGTDIGTITMPSPAQDLAIWNKFGYVGVVCYTGYKDRFALLQEELKRVGITEYYPHWDFPSPYKEIIKAKTPMAEWNKQGTGFFIGLNNYRAIATAYNLGHERCLIMEDDVRFLKDTAMLEKILADLPSDFDLAMLDHNDPTSNDQTYLLNFTSPVTEYWCRFKILSSSGCYAMSRRGMNRFLDLYESPFKRKTLLKANDCYFNENDFGGGMNLYASKICPAMQIAFPGCHGDAYMDRYYRIHEMLGMKREMYGD